MKWWRMRRPAADPDAARRQLEEARSRRREVERLASELERRRRENRFGERVARAFEGRS